MIIIENEPLLYNITIINLLVNGNLRILSAMVI
jgi:hypothetical protein